MLPLSDSNRAYTTPVITWLLIAACVAVFVYQFSLLQNDPGAGQAFIDAYGMRPALLFGYMTADYAPVPAWATVITSMFLHGGILHLAGNMLYLWIFGDNVEDAMGGFKYVIFYLLCGVAAAMTQAYVQPDSDIPMVGASGAISGVLGAYLFMYPRHNVNTLIFLGFFITVIRVPALIVLGFWFALQLASAWFAPTDEPGVAFWAHVGGFVAGVVLHRLFGRPRASLQY